MVVVSPLLMVLLIVSIFGSALWVERRAELFRVPLLPEQVVSIPVAGRVVLARGSYFGFPKHDFGFTLLDSSGRPVPYARSLYDRLFPARYRHIGVFSVPAPGTYLFRIEGLRDADRGTFVAFSKPFRLRSFVVMWAVLAPFLLDLLLRAPVQLPAEYYGTWEGSGTVIVLTPGHIDYRKQEWWGGSSNFGGPIHQFAEGRLVSRIFFINNSTWHVDLPPHQRDGKWSMIVDGVELTRR